MKIKRFLEMFDNEELKAKHEIDWLSGKLDDLGKKVEYNQKNETIARFIYKLSGMHFPFFMAFNEATKKESGELDFEGFKISTHFNESDRFFSFSCESDNYLVVLGVKINRTDNYDIHVAKLNKKDESDYDGYEYKNIDFNGVVGIIHSKYLNYLESCGFQDLTYYDYQRYKEVNN